MNIAPPLSIHSVALNVRDLDRVAAFYQRVVGLDVLGGTAGALHLGAGGIPFLELQHRPDAPLRDPAAAGLFHTAFLLPDRAALGRWLKHAGSSSVQIDGAADHLVSEAVYIADPEGNGIEVYADRPAEGWTWTSSPAGPQITMANARLDAQGLLALADTPWQGAPPGTTIGHVHLQVGEIEAATRFYVDVVGMDITARRPSAAFLSSGGYHHHLAVNTWNSEGAPPRDAGHAGLAAVSLAATEGPARHLQDPWGTQIHILPATTR